MRVVAAMSGGVDSSVAAALLVEQGHDVVGVFLRSGVTSGPAAARGRQGCCSAGDAADAARVADLLGIAFYSLDFSAGFDRIIDDFVRAYAAGRTPNPCVQCNRDLKFGELLRFADAVGADAVATGHYAEVEERNGRAALRVPVDKCKDQTYVLFPLTQSALRRTSFPLAKMTKDQTRDAAARRGLPVAEKPESMEICFVPDGDYREIVSRREPRAVTPGDILDAATGAVVGRHAGVGTVTMGQRRGVGVVAGSPRYVTAVDVERNLVVVGDESQLLRRELTIEGWNPVAATVPPPGRPLRGFAKVRRSHVPSLCEVRRRIDEDGDSETSLTALFDEPVRAPAAGQALVLYDDEGRVLGGGWIASSR
jgi:tRNA-specific 2-thiouridylase